MRLPTKEAAVFLSISSQSPPGLTEEPATTCICLVGVTHLDYLRKGPAS